MAEGRTPTVVVDNAHIIYRIHGAISQGANTPLASFKRLISRQNSAAVTEVHAVKGVSFVAYKGEAIGLVGSNGSGKSTLLAAIAGLLPVEAGGAIYAAGQPSLLGVNAALMNDLSGEKNVELGCLAMGMTPEQTAEKLPGIIEFSGINERGNFGALPMRTYSSGMGARLRFSISAAKKHDVLLIDEALATGDAKFRKRSEARVRELRGEAGTVFLVSHSEQSIRDTCERAIWLESGEVRADGPTADVMKEYESYMNK